MCGICGGYNLSDKNIVRKMCDMIKHRGPDADGYYFGSEVVLGMRRLKVIDLDSGNQPIFNEDKSVVVIFNGEIYNYRENRKYLEQRGHKFHTQSDTETIVHLYEELGEKCVERLNGMFAFALWDINKKKLVLARDRIGIKPLYYWHEKGIFLFSSEIKSLLVFPHLTKELNFHALHDYLTFQYIPAPDTIFRNVYKLLPGNLLVWEKGNFKIKQYWDITNNKGKKKNRYDEENLSEQFLKLMKESINNHLISDVPVGLFLSGGTDSGTITALVSEVTDKKIKTFSIGFEDKYYNELALAKLISNKYGTDHHEFIVKPTGLELLEEIIGFFDEPFADSSAIPTYFVSKYARQYVSVALSGDGGDEIFGGYGNYKADKIGYLFRKLPAILREDIIPLFFQNLLKKHETVQLNKLLKMSNFSQAHGHVFWLSVFNKDSKEKLYKNKHFDVVLAIDSLKKYDNYFEEFNHDDFINCCINVDLKTVLPDDYLVKVDRMSMANSLEVRVPFLDHKLIEFATSIPSAYKIKGLTTKYLLKKIMKNRLPAEIIYGKKKGFSIPLNRWFKEDFSILINKYLSKEIVQKRGYFCYEFINNLCQEHLTGRKDNSKQIWTLICFEIWNNKYLN